MIKSFFEIDEEDRRYIGSKAFNLSVLIKSDINVPKGFVVFNKNNAQNLLQEINSQSFDQNLLKYINQLDGKLFAVRSSVSIEDGTKQSFAGQFRTYTNVKAEDVKEHIIKCIESSSKTDTDIYKNKAESKDIYFSIIIQDMVLSEYAGVAMSIDPVINDPDFIVIEIAKGLGENVVSGIVSPQYFKINRKDVNKFPKDKFNGVELSTIIENIFNIEKIIGRYIDIEFAIRDKKLFILQVRPITTFPLS